MTSHIRERYVYLGSIEGLDTSLPSGHAPLITFSMATYCTAPHPHSN